MPSSYLTREGFEKLEQELEYLRSEKRNEVARRLQEAMEDGELIENAEYEDAKNEQAFTEGRIKDLELLLANAQIIDEEDNEKHLVQVGSTVTIVEDDGEPETYMIVGPAEADPRQRRISHESPIGHALINHKVGDKVKVDAPGGAFTVQITKID
ncbi:MAG TPA: transcription elongation factor GreA [Anaerolineaceae bacterium]|nr:transcription elongation factor GreA [Chloroflexota bacterium]HNY84528.1 transcription elongation factor GreA [Anaerolineaceae bacterium]